jgi:hypothetical protein
VRRDELVAHLQTMSGGAVVLTTEQLSRCLSMNPKVISRMRQEGRFPIPHKTVGARKIIYPLGVVVDYLLESPPSSAINSGAVTQPQGDVTRRKPSGKRASLPDLSRQMLLRGFLEAVSNQMQLLTGIEITLQRQLAYEDLDTTVPNASSTRSAPRQGKI